MHPLFKSTTLLLAAFATPLASRSEAGDNQPDGRKGRKGPQGQQPAKVESGAPRQSININPPARQGGNVGGMPQFQKQMPKLNVQNPPRFNGGNLPVMNNNGANQNNNGNGNGNNIRKPVVNVPVQKPVLEMKRPDVMKKPDVVRQPDFKLLPGQGKNRLPEISKKPVDTTPKPIVNIPMPSPVDTGKQPAIKTFPDLSKRLPEVSKEPAGPARNPGDNHPDVDLSKKLGDKFGHNKPGKLIDPGFNAKHPPKVDLPGKDIVRVPGNVFPKPHDNKPHDHGHKQKGPVQIADGHKLHIAQPGNTFADRMKKGDFHNVVDSKFGKQLNLKKQFELHQHGDLGRQLNLGQNLAQHGGWQKRFCGPIDPHYTSHCFSSWYCGPSYFPGHCWFPTWNPWVNWCWNFNCLPICDPRPIYCRPIYYDPCLVWGGWSYPVWTPMPVVTCGTWVDVPTVVVNAGYDVQLLAVRFVDPGHPEQQLGPRYRVWLRNNSPVAIQQPFNLVAYASNDREPGTGLPEVGLRIQGMEAGQIQSVDVRLPVEANTLFVDAEGRNVPFQFLHVISDSHREIPEAFEENNGAVMARGDILPVDPALFAADSEQTIVSGSVVSLAGEGFGPEPGQVLVNVGGVEYQAEIVGWYDLGVQVRLNGITLASNVPAELVVVRGDQAASNPLTVNLVTNASQATAFQLP